MYPQVRKRTCVGYAGRKSALSGRCQKSSVQIPTYCRNSNGTPLEKTQSNRRVQPAEVTAEAEKSKKSK